MVLKKRTKSVAKARKKAAKRTARRTTSSLPETSAKTRASLFKGIHQVLDAHGIAGQVAELHIDGANASVAAPCPPNTIQRVVCVRQDDGTMHCEERCVPV